MNTHDAWITLDLMPNIGPRCIQALLEVYHAPEAILKASPEELKSLGILKKPQLASLATGVAPTRVREVLQLLDALGASTVCLDDAAYPAALRQLSDPPTVLYVKGSLEEIEPAAAIVGTRAPSFYGRDTAQVLARDLSTCGITIISGLARGIDTAAHTGALEGVGGTIAVLGSGLDILYPPENRELAERIALKGALVTEFPPGTPPDARNFPRRNRLIAGLSTGVIVVEATTRSGAMITARLAGEQGRLVMAVPGAVTNIRSQGPHRLIRQGATLVQNADEVLQEIAPQVEGILQQAGTPEKGHPDEIVGLMGGESLSMEQIASGLKMSISEVAQRVSRLELEGRIVRLKGNRFAARRDNG